jgi:hypothetical protein
MPACIFRAGLARRIASLSFLIGHKIRVQCSVGRLPDETGLPQMELTGSAVFSGLADDGTGTALLRRDDGTPNLRALCPDGTTRSGPRARESLSLHIIAFDRVPLPASADVLRICRRSARAAWPLGRRLDDTRKIVAVPPLWDIRSRLRAKETGTCPLVHALALRTLARHQRRADMTALAAAGMSA